MAGYPGKLTAKCYINVGDKKVLWYEIDENENVTWYLPPEESEYYKRKMLDNIGENMSRLFGGKQMNVKEETQF